MKTIHGTITTSVTLGAGGYGPGLTIATDGAVIPSQPGANGIYAPSSLTNAHVVNDGTVQGANGTKQVSTGGTGICLAGGGKVANSGVVMGGNGARDIGQGGDGVLLQAIGSVSNSGTIMGGYTFNSYGGVGVDLAQGGSLTNHGLITGSSIGVALGAAGTVQNFGTITGGANYGNYGVEFSAGGTLSNHGTIGGNNFAEGSVLFAGPGQIGNFGVIQGGLGGQYGYGDEDGGTGVSLSGGGTLTNHASIAGGNGGDGFHYHGGNGGDGVYLDGGTLIASSGTIAGGAGGDGSKKGIDGAAVRFGSIAGTLVVDAGAQFVGNIVANTAVDDTLVLSGKTAGTLAGLGKTVTGFTTITESAHATWTLQGTLTGAGTLTIGNGAHLELSGPVNIATIQFANGAQSLQLDKNTAVTSTFAGFGTGDTIDLVAIQATSLQYANGTLTLLNAQGASVEKLLFAGDYTMADFALHTVPNGTELDYAGAAPSYRESFGNMGGHASLFRDDPYAFMHDWHALTIRD